MNRVSLVLSTHNRLEELKYTLSESNLFFNTELYQVILFDDGSTDGTSDFIAHNYPFIKLIRSDTKRGIFYARNQLFEAVNTEYIISLDDDTCFIDLSQDLVDKIVSFFDTNSDCSVLAFRIFWSLNKPQSTSTKDIITRVKSYGAGACAYRISHIRNIPKLPEWFVFYGEENFISMHLFKQNKSVYYFPLVLIHHRVNNKSRTYDKDYFLRSKLSLLSSWYIIFLFFPLKPLLKSFIYSIKAQISSKFSFKNYFILKVILFSFITLIFNFYKLIKLRNSFSVKEYLDYSNLDNAKLYWNGND